MCKFSKGKANCVKWPPEIQWLCASFHPSFNIMISFLKMEFFKRTERMDYIIILLTVFLTDAHLSKISGMKLPCIMPPSRVKYILLGSKPILTHVLCSAHVLKASSPEARDTRCFLLTCAGNIKLFNETIDVKVHPKEMKTLFRNLYRV